MSYDKADDPMVQDALRRLVAADEKSRSAEARAMRAMRASSEADGEAAEARRQAREAREFLSAMIGEA